MTSKIYTVANRKGGCSKTTTVKAMAEILSRIYNKKVLCIDCDPQGNLTDWSKINTNDDWTLYELIKNECSVFDAIKKANDYDIIPADETLAQAETELIGKIGSEQSLKKQLINVIDEYDYILIDTPPSLGLLSIIAYVATINGVIIATDSKMFATKGINKLFENITAIRDSNYNTDIKVAGILLTKFDDRFISDKAIADVTKELTDTLNVPLYKTRVRTSVDMTLATTYSMSLLDLKPEPKPVTDYKNFVNEFLKEENLK